MGVVTLSHVRKRGKTFDANSNLLLAKVFCMCFNKIKVRWRLLGTRCPIRFIRILNWRNFVRADSPLRTFICRMCNFLEFDGTVRLLQPFWGLVVQFLFKNGPFLLLPLLNDALSGQTTRISSVTSHFELKLLQRCLWGGFRWLFFLDFVLFGWNFFLYFFFLWLFFVSKRWLLLLFGRICVIKCLVELLNNIKYPTLDQFQVVFG